jgi:hypothetical protein
VPEMQNDDAIKFLSLGFVHGHDIDAGNLQRGVSQLWTATFSATRRGSRKPGK